MGYTEDMAEVITLRDDQKAALEKIAAKFGKDPSTVLDDLLGTWDLDLSEPTEDDYKRGLQRTLSEWSSADDARAFDHL